MSTSTGSTHAYTGIEDLITCMGFLDANKYYNSTKIDTSLNSYLSQIPGSNNLIDGKFENIIYQQADRTANIRNIDKKILASSCSFFDSNPQPLNFITREEILNESKKYTTDPVYKEPIIKDEEEQFVLKLTKKPKLEK